MTAHATNFLCFSVKSRGFHTIISGGVNLEIHYYFRDYSSCCHINNSLSSQIIVLSHRIHYVFISVTFFSRGVTIIVVPMYNKILSLD